MADDQAPGPLQIFCARLRRLQLTSGLTQVALARHAGMSKSHMSEILNGAIKRPPDWRVVNSVITACLDHAVKTARVLPPDVQSGADWRRRYDDLEQDTTNVYVRQRAAKPESSIGQHKPRTSQASKNGPGTRPDTHTRPDSGLPSTYGHESGAKAHELTSGAGSSPVSDDVAIHDRIGLSRQARILIDVTRTAMLIPSQYAKAAALSHLADVLASSDPERAATIRDDALSAARLISDAAQKADVLCYFSDVIAPTDPRRAARLATDSYEAAKAILDEEARAFALAKLAQVVASTDPANAVRLVRDAENSAHAMRHEIPRAFALAALLPVMADIDPAGASRLAADSERAAYALPPLFKMQALRALINAMADRDRDFATRLATEASQTGIYGPWSQEDLGEHQKALIWAAIDPDRAATICRSITDADTRASALTDLAEALASRRPDFATQLAREAEQACSASDSSLKHLTLINLVNVTAVLDPSRAAQVTAKAEEAIRAYPSEFTHASGLAHLALAVGPFDPERASWLVYDAEQAVRAIGENAGASTLIEVLQASSAFAPERAARLADQAEQAARAIRDTNERVSALTNIVQTMAAIDPERAEGAARAISNDQFRVRALLILAEALMNADRPGTVGASATKTREHLHANIGRFASIVAEY